MATIAITGAKGFIGKQTVDAARARGHMVRTIVRHDCDFWDDDDGVETYIADLADDTSRGVLLAAIDGTDAVIHLASSLKGDDAAQTRDTLTSINALLVALAAVVPRPTLVTASSFSVYGFVKCTSEVVVDEATPCELRPEKRDAYCRGKLAQESAVYAAERPAWIMRPGAVFGPDRLWNAYLGSTIGPVALVFGGYNIVPVAWVNHVAKALVLAAEIPPDGVEIVNVIDDDLPDQMTYIQECMASGWPKYAIPMPVWPLTTIGAIGGLIPSFNSRLPGLLLPETRRARLQPKRYSNRLLHNRLGWTPDADFKTAMKDAISKSRGPI